eukprot:TRINITY_DN60_c0_g1_i1.p1 TRINITY_DN60_c0_g1~~TRINITY_DN60_c0_g1_i1.p1  ORF type:complete len:153 (-),score=19.42 TRINITY_DN60_c0_g1_i1:306-764(-)
MTLESQDLLLGHEDLYNIWQWLLRSLLSLWVPWQHNSNLQTNNSRLEENVTDSLVDVVVGGITRLLHVTITELHGLGSLSSKLSGYDDFATLGFVLHNETDNTIASTSDGQTVQELELEGLSLSNSRETTEEYTLSVQLNGALSETETLGND